MIRCDLQVYFRMTSLQRAMLKSESMTPSGVRSLTGRLMAITHVFWRMAKQVS
jgi:hypothetical protein